MIRSKPSSCASSPTVRTERGARSASRRAPAMSASMLAPASLSRHSTTRRSSERWLRMTRPRRSRRSTISEAVASLTPRMPARWPIDTGPDWASPKRRRNCPNLDPERRSLPGGLEQRLNVGQSLVKCYTRCWCFAHDLILRRKPQELLKKPARPAAPGSAIPGARGSISRQSRGRPAGTADRTSPSVQRHYDLMVPLARS